MDTPETRYAKLGGDHIAFQVMGGGPPDVLWLSNIGDCIDARWEFEQSASFFRRIAAFSRLIMFDRRGVGASDPVPIDALPSWEEWTGDALSVLDAVGSERATVVAETTSGPTAALFAATQPERTQALLLFNSAARFAADADYPWGMPPGDIDKLIELIEDGWGTQSTSSLGIGESPDVGLQRWMAKMQRMACSPKEAGAYMRQAQNIDVRHVLGSIRVPTLVVHRAGAPMITIQNGQYLADHIPAARFVSIPGEALTVLVKPNQVLDLIEELATGATPVDTDRALAAVLFTDIVASTEQAASLGDRRWRSLIETHDRVVTEIVQQHRGRLVKTTGDGLLATFDGPGRAIRCASVLMDALRPLGLHIRAGLHTGEIEIVGQDVAGIAVHIAQRVCGLADANEILVSRTVPDLVAGSGVEFEDRGEHDLKGVPGTWRLYAVEG